MALTAQQQNFLSDLTTLSADTIELLHRISELKARYFLNGMNTSLQDADLLALPTFAHLTAAKVTNAITAITTVETALGDTVSGQQINLIKMEG